MMERLFELDETIDGCRYPMVQGASGYRYGCRCSRCRSAHYYQAKPSPTCHVDGCEGVRLHQRKVCIDHLPRCAAPECTNPRRLVSGAKYCEEHATSIDYRWIGTSFVTASCVLCGDATTARQREPHPLCDSHNHLRQLVRGWATHNLTPDRMIQLATNPHCWICGGDLSWRFHHWAKADGAVHVEHDHTCCPGERSACGRCVRGLAHADCNRQLGHMEKLLAKIGIDGMLDLLTKLGKRAENHA